MKSKCCDYTYQVSISTKKGRRLFCNKCCKPCEATPECPLEEEIQARMEAGEKPFDKDWEEELHIAMEEKMICGIYQARGAIKEKIINN